MSEKEMLDSLEEIWMNLSFDGDRAIYSKMLAILDDIRYFLHNDLQIDYPKVIYDKFAEVKQGSFDF